MADWKLAPDGDLINFNHVEFVRVREEKVQFFMSSGTVHTFNLDADWKKFLRTLPERLYAENVID